MSDPVALELAVRRDLWAALDDRDRASATILAAAAAFADRLGCARPRLTVTRDDADDAPPLRLAGPGGARQPSVASWLRASAAALGRFPRLAEVERSIAGALLAAAGTPAVAIGLGELVLELVRADPGLLRPRRAARAGATLPGLVAPATPASPGAALDPARPASRAAAPATDEPASRIRLTIHDDDVAALFAATDPEALGSELARLVWETTGIPIALRIAIDPAQRRGVAGVRIAGIDECAIPLLPDGHVLTSARASDDRVVPVAGNALWLVRAERLAPGDARIEPAWALAACLLDVVRERAPRLLCRGALDEMYRVARASAPATLAMAVARLGRDRLDALIAELVRHATPLGDLRCVCQAVTEYTALRAAPDGVVLGNTAAELLSFVRIRLGARIVGMLSDGEAYLRAHLVDPGWAEIAERGVSPGHGELLRAAVRRASLGAIGGGSRWRIVVLVKLSVRALVADLLRGEFPHVTVVAFEEVPAWVTIEPQSPSIGGPPGAPRAAPAD